MNITFWYCTIFSTFRCFYNMYKRANGPLCVYKYVCSSIFFICKFLAELHGCNRSNMLCKCIVCFDDMDVNYTFMTAPNAIHSKLNYLTQIAFEKWRFCTVKHRYIDSALLNSAPSLSPLCIYLCLYLMECVCQLHAQLNWIQRVIKCLCGLLFFILFFW